MRPFTPVMVACLLAILIHLPSATHAAFLSAESAPPAQQAKDLTAADMESQPGSNRSGPEKLSFKLNKKQLSKFFAKGAVTSDKTNGLAIARLITRFLLPPVGIVLSIIALGKIKRAEEGRGLALSGLIIGSVLTGLILFYFISFNYFYAS